MSFPRYPEYKESGVEWLGEVPGHWEVKRIGYYFSERREKVSDTDYAPLSVTMGGIVPQIETAAKTDDSDNRKKVCVGDFVINSRSDRKGSAGVSRLEGSVSLISTVLYPHDKSAVFMSFMHHLLRSVPFQEEYYRNGKGIVADLWSTNYSAMRNILLPLPPLPEQTAIAAFLDRETAKIDALVAEQRRLIELLKEKRQAVISHAVTKGLNPDAPMKDSGIEWLGEVPAHWGLTVIKRFSTLHRGHDLTDAERTDGDYPVITSGGYSGTHGAFMARGPGVVTGRYGSTGRLFYVEEDFWPHNTSLYVSEFHGNLPRFVWYSLQTVDFASHSAKAAVPGIDRNDIHVLPAVVPPISEQEDVVAFLDSELAKLDTLTSEAQRAIDLLQERRTALISAAVTGQIDVR